MVAIIVVVLVSFIVYTKIWESKMEKEEIANLKKNCGKIGTRYLKDFELKDFKICPKELLDKAQTIDTVLTYSKEFDGESDWTIFKDLESEHYHMYFDVILRFKDKSRKDQYCFYDAGLFRDNMVLKNVPSGYSVSQIYFLKYDEKKKQYYGEILSRGLDGNGAFKKNSIHELIIPPQTMPPTSDGSRRDVQFYIRAIPKK